MIRVHLDRLLFEKKWSRAYFSRIIDVRYNTVNDLYHEFAEGIKFEHLDRMRKALKCKPTDLIEYVPDEKD